MTRTRAYKEKTGKYRGFASFKDMNGIWRNKTKSGFDTKKEAEDWAIKYEVNRMVLVEKLIESRKKTETKKHTLSYLFNEYIKDAKFYGRRESTIVIYKAAQKFWSGITIPVEDLSPYDINEYYKEKVVKKNYKYNYRQSVKVLKAVLNFAIKEMRIIETSPAENLKIARAINENKEKEKFITYEKYKEIYNSLDDGKYKLAIKIAYYTGMRSGEIKGITKESLNIPNAIEVKQQFSATTKKMTTKLKTKNSYRVFPISEEFYNELLSFPFPWYNRLNLQAIYLHLKKFNVSMHSFRHTRATILLTSGVDPTVVASVMGDTLEVIMKIYLQINKDHEKKAHSQIRSLM